MMKSAVKRARRLSARASLSPRRAVTRFAEQIRLGHGLLDRSTAERLSRLIRASVTARRKPGRKPSPEALLASLVMLLAISLG